MEALAASKYLVGGGEGAVRETSWFETTDGGDENTESSRFPFSSLANLSERASILDLVRN
jgi:hypothetical protein